MPPTSHLRNLRQALNTCRRALEEFESALQEFEEVPDENEEEPGRSLNGHNLRLLSLPDVCQELGMGKSWVYRRIQSGEIPSVKLGHNIKVRREDLEGYLEAQLYRSTTSGPALGDQ